MWNDMLTLDIGVPEKIVRTVAVYLVLAVLELALFLVLAAVLVLWPLITEAGRRRWEWVALLVLLGPLAGVVWWVVGRRAAPARA